MTKLLWAVFVSLSVLSCNTVSKKEYHDPATLWGELYSDVEKAKLFSNPKEFWDAAPNLKAENLLKFYHKEKQKENFDLKAFVTEHFAVPDYTVAYQTSDESFENYVQNTFQSLITKPKDDGGSLVPTRMRYLDGGGMFNEYNYFRTYFGVKAFQALKDDSMAVNTATNPFQFIQDYGYVPYGNRSYYLGFTNLPVLSLMAETIADKSPEMLPWFGNLMARDYQVWMNIDENSANQTTAALEDSKVLNKYYSTNAGNAYISLLQTTEWKGSSRFLVNDKQNVTDFIPVDLNALLFHYEKVLSRSFESKNRKEYAESYTNLSKIRTELVDKYLYNAEKGFYYDYNLKTKKQSEAETLAAIFPILTGLSTTEQTQRVIEKLEKQFLTNHGVLNDLSQENGSAEMNYLTILALRKANRNDLADTLKQRWIELNKSYFAKNRHILAVYNLKNPELSSKNPARIDGALAVLITLLNE